MEHSNPILMGNDSPQKFITIGEVMLRLTPPNYEKIRMASSFEASYGGSEANIALALANLGVDSTFFSVVPNNSLGKSAVRWLCLLYTSPSPRDKRQSRMPSSA